MWLRARERTEELDQAKHSLWNSELRNQLSSAALDSRRGKYETAREELSKFYDSLAAAVNGSKNLNASPQELKSFQPFLAQRDDLITLLARSDPASADRLSSLDQAFQKALPHP